MKSPLSNRPDAGTHRAAVALAALGVVFGDIGTSPLYAFRVCLSDQAAGTPATESALGIVSLMVWTLLIVVTLKYAWLILSVDNDGEGGILALSSLVGRALGARVDGGGRHRTILWLGIFGTTLFLADGMITPAISVLSAIEGVEVVAPGTEFLVVPATLVALGLLFALQRQGTAWVGALFGPVIVVWFATIGVLGLRGLCANPAVLAAINPVHALGFLVGHRLESLHILGGVFLVATGAEALYADLGHFGAVPIRLAWTGVALPCLLLNYFGQAALVMEEPDAVANPFYHLAPGWFQIPLLLLAAVATLIASQAVITGAFSVARQAVMLGLTPRLEVRHTSSLQEGQVYVPAINWLLLVGAIALVIGFGGSEGVAHAYGLAVALTMLITSFLLVIYLRRVAGWTVWRCWLVAAPLLAIDAAFALANGSKLLSGGWLPLVVAGCGFYLMMTWHRGQGLLRRLAGDIKLSEGELLQSLRLRQPVKVRGTAIFLTRLTSGVPGALLHVLKHTKSLHENVVLLTVVVSRKPRVAEGSRIAVTRYGTGFHRLTACYGFMERPNVPELVAEAQKRGLLPKLQDCTYFLGRLTLQAATRPRLRWFWRGLFFFLFRNAHQVISHLRIPPSRVIEIGQLVEI